MSEVPYIPTVWDGDEKTDGVMLRALALMTLAKWKGTPHRDHAAELGKGIDCIHLVREPFAEAGLIDRRPLGNYKTERGALQKSEHLEVALVQCLFAQLIDPTEPVQFGDIVIFENGDGRSAHCGFIETFPDGKAEVWHSLAHRCVTRSPWVHWRHRCKSIIRVRRPGFRADPQTIK